MGCTSSKQKETPDETSLIKEPQKDTSNDPLNIKQKEKGEETSAEPVYVVPFQDWTPPDWSPPLEEVEGTLLGEVYLTVHHIPANNQVAVRLMRARHLHRRGETADIQFAMCLCYPSGKKDEQKSTIKKATIDPVLDERFTWEIDQGEKGEETVFRLVANDLTQDPPYIGEIVIGIGRMGFGLLNPAWIALRNQKFIPKIETPPDTRTSSPTSGLEVPLLSSVASVASEAMNGAMHGAASVTKGAVNVTMGAVNLAKNTLHLPDFSPKKSDGDAFSVAQSYLSSASNASNSAIVKMHDYGKVYLSLYYKVPQNLVEIAVVSARLDRPANMSLPNPYVKIKLVPDLSGKNGKQKTKTQKATNEPFFNESFSVHVEKKEIQKLQVSLWSNELGKNPFLGEALINLSTLPANETLKEWFPLESLSHGELNCHLAYDHESDALSVTIIKARDLLGNGGSMIDPYVKLYLLPDPKKSSKRKTKCKKQTLNPEFNESFRFFLPEFDNAALKFLHVSVLNHNSMGHQDPVGSFSIPMAEIIEAQSIERWFPLIRDKAAPEKNPSSPNTPVRKEE